MIAGGEFRVTVQASDSAEPPSHEPDSEPLTRTRRSGPPRRPRLPQTRSLGTDASRLSDLDSEPQAEPVRGNRDRATEGRGTRRRRHQQSGECKFLRILHINLNHVHAQAYIFCIIVFLTPSCYF